MSHPDAGRKSNASPSDDEGTFDPLVGRLIDGRYRLDGRIGEGGFAVVYDGTQEELQRQVAVKVLQEDLGDPRHWQQRFEREARALAALSHPHIVNLIDYGVVDNAPYLVMERLTGRTLRALCRETTLDEARIFSISRQILHAVGYAHASGVVHRDLKPTNVFVQSLPHITDHVKILDFGFAKFFEGEDARNGPPLTQIGTAFGTPAYIAPEQASGQPTDGRADLYGTGVLLFEMFAGRRPFEGEAAEMIRHKLSSVPPRLQDVCAELQTRPELEALLQRALARRPDERFHSADEMLAALDAVPRPAVVRHPPAAAAHAHSSVPKPGPWPWLSGLVAGMPRAQLALLCAVPAMCFVLASTLLGTWLWSRTDAPARAPAPAHADARPADPSGDDPNAPTLSVDDPWTGGPVPAELEAVRRKVRNGREASGTDLGTLRQYASAHPDDPRPRLLAGHVFTRRKWWTDALEQYRQAYRIDSQSRGDRRMLVNLVTMIGRRSVSRRAADAVEEMYGEQALPVVDAALERDLSGPQRNRLQRFRRELAP